jgi:hypothetical protein
MKTERGAVPPSAGLILKWSREGRCKKRPFLTDILPDRRFDVAASQRVSWYRNSVYEDPLLEGTRVGRFSTVFAPFPYPPSEVTLLGLPQLMASCTLYSKEEKNLLLSMEKGDRS